MIPDSDRRQRQSLRLQSYDYSLAGAYYVTIVAQNRATLFGLIQHNTMNLSPAGEMLGSIWQSLPTRFPNIALDLFVVMPNHFHGILLIEERVPTRGTPTQNADLGAIVGAWKSLTTVAYGTGVKTQGWTPFAGRLWQRNYYEHIVRGHDDLTRIRYYIETNPQEWASDSENPQQSDS